MSRLVLDLRDKQRNVASGLRLTNATATGEVGGYRVESQLRTGRGLKGLSMRLTAPDGRVLHVVGHPGISPDNAKSPVTGALSPQVGYAFRERRTPEMETDAIRAIEATITTGLDCLTRHISGARARVRVQCAALDLDHDTVHAYLHAHTQIRMADPALKDLPRERLVSDLTVQQVGWLLAARIGPDEIQHWFYTRDFHGKNHVLVDRHLP